MPHSNARPRTLRRHKKMKWFFLLVVALQAGFVLFYSWRSVDRSDLVVMCKLIAAAANILLAISFIGQAKPSSSKKVDPDKQIYFDAIPYLLYACGAGFALSIGSLFWGEKYFHFILVYICALLYLFIDVILSKCFSSQVDNAEGKASLYFSDIPNICAFSVLFLLYWLYRGPGKMYEFVSGAIAFQWLASNVIFVTIQFLHSSSPEGLASIIAPVETTAQDDINGSGPAPPDRF